MFPIVACSSGKSQVVMLANFCVRFPENTDVHFQRWCNFVWKIDVRTRAKCESAQNVKALWNCKLSFPAMTSQSSICHGNLYYVITIVLVFSVDNDVKYRYPLLWHHCLIRLLYNYEIVLLLHKSAFYIICGIWVIPLGCSTYLFFLSLCLHFTKSGRLVTDKRAGVVNVCFLSTCVR